jgi:hypothetical protein
MSTDTREAARSAHLTHVAALLRHIHAVRTGDGAAESKAPAALFLGLDEGSHFWELIGFRVRGHGSVVLGAIRFPRQPSKQEAHARRSLIHYLSQPPKELGLSGTARPAGLIEVRLPDAQEPIPAFLARMRAGEPVRAIYVHADHVDLAFDFRVDNPSEDRHVRMNQRSAEVHVLRTVGGHVLSGYCGGLHTKLHKDGDFLALSQAVQHTPARKLLLPNLALHRAFLTMDALCPAGAGPETWTEHTIPFLAALAQSRHLLDTGP